MASPYAKLYNIFKLALVHCSSDPLLRHFKMKSIQNEHLPSNAVLPHHPSGIWKEVLDLGNPFHADEASADYQDLG